ncbi:DUF6318 family protein [Pseudarthrobacter sp. DSP2-3-2b1]|uniref:DUF6318 family protein n=1 Tax=Pseudarthrobacter sp. DSP2-3-2b1 TaxID=2804661 RepID=UPI003CFB3157
MTSHQLTSSWRIRTGGVALVVAAAVALSGCNSGGDPNPAATATTSAAESISPSATPTPTATYKPADATGRAQNVPVPVLPEVAKTETKEGLEAFVAHWFQLLGYAYETGDPKPMEAISDPSCTFCGSLSDNISAAWSDDKWIVGGRVETPVVTAKMLPGEAAQATVQVVQKSIAIHNPDGSLYQDPTKDTNAGSQATATFGASGWVLADLGLIR